MAVKISYVVQIRHVANVVAHSGHAKATHDRSDAVSHHVPHARERRHHAVLFGGRT